MAIERTQQFGPWEVHSFIHGIICLGPWNQEGWCFDHQSRATQSLGWKRYHWDATICLLISIYRSIYLSVYSFALPKVLSVRQTWWVSEKRHFWMEYCLTLKGKGGTFERTALTAGKAQCRMESVLTKALSTKEMEVKIHPNCRHSGAQREVDFEWQTCHTTLF